MRRNIPKLKHERLIEALHYSPSSGEFTWKIKTGTAKAGQRAGTISHGRVYIRIDGERFFAHRLAWFYMHKKWPEQVIDHINGDSLDNRIINLRDVSRSINNQNLHSPRPENKYSDLVGVTWRKCRRRWRARIRINGKQIELGYFHCKHEAHKAYLKARRASAGF